jgi:[ribosomal protein S18]-alanine N-acetyltransferase
MSGVEFILREFKREDFEILWDIDQKCFSPGISYSRLELAAYIRRRGSLTIVAELIDAKGGTAKQIVGFIVAEIDRRGIGHIITIDVVGAARRSGVGSRLLAGAEDQLRAVQCRSVRLETAVDNLGALAFYKRHSYFLERTVPHYYSNGVDALILRKDLLAQAKSS